MNFNRPPKKLQNRKLFFTFGVRAFSMVEMLVAMTVLSTGFLAMAAFMLQITAQQGRNATYSELRELANAKMGQLAHVDFTLLATGSTAEEKEFWGAPGQEIVILNSRNKAGQVADGTNFGPFKYSLNFVICLDDLDGGASASGAGGDPCGNVTTSRPDELSCDVGTMDEGQAIVKVLVTSRDRNGRCEKYTLTKVLVDLTS